MNEKDYEFRIARIQYWEKYGALPTNDDINDFLVPDYYEIARIAE